MKTKPNSLEMYEWIDFYEPKHLTVDDLDEWKSGKSKDVLVWDRNFEEYDIWTNKTKDKDYSPKVFFGSNKCKVTYNGDLTWTILDKAQLSNCHEIEINVRMLGSKCCDWCPLEFDKSGDAFVKIGRKKIYWDDLPGDIRIGWRGPMMFWNEIEKSPSVYLGKN